MDARSIARAGFLAAPAATVVARAIGFESKVKLDAGLRRPFYSRVGEAATVEEQHETRRTSLRKKRKMHIHARSERVNLARWLGPLLV